MKSIPILALLMASVAAGGSVAACGSSADTSAPGSFPAEPLSTVTTSAGDLTVEIRGAPQPLTRGNVSIELTVTNTSTSTPASGLAVAVVPWMPAMGHGTSITPTVTEVAPGKYVVTDVDLFMPGTWQLRTTISGAMSGNAEPSFEIP